MQHAMSRRTLPFANKELLLSVVLEEFRRAGGAAPDTRDKGPRVMDVEGRGTSC